VNEYDDDDDDADDGRPNGDGGIRCLRLYVMHVVYSSPLSAYLPIMYRLSYRTISLLAIAATYSLRRVLTGAWVGNTKYSYAMAEYTTMIKYNACIAKNDNERNKNVSHHKLSARAILYGSTGACAAYPFSEPLSLGACSPISLSFLP